MKVARVRLRNTPGSIVTIKDVNSHAVTDYPERLIITAEDSVHVYSWKDVIAYEVVVVES